MGRPMTQEPKIETEITIKTKISTTGTGTNNLASSSVAGLECTGPNGVVLHFLAKLL